MPTNDDRRVLYIVSEELVRLASRLPSNKGRSAYVHTLIGKLGLPTPAKGVRVLRPTRASRDDLLAYHDPGYVDRLLDSTHTNDEHSDVLYGIEDDCPAFEGLDAYVCLIAGGALAAARALRDDEVDIAIFWDGGRHHASKSHAAGFCYVSDCVLALLALRRQPQSPTAGPQLSSAQPSAPPHRRRRRRRVMYIDLDLHFGDGVCEAFSQSVQRGPTGTTATAAQVLTLSIHHAAPGFYPLSPLAALPRPPGIAHPRPSSEGPHDDDDDDDERPFDPYTLALPLERGTSDATLARVWDTAVEPVRAAFSPDAVLVQCGADGLAGDPCAVWNVSAAGLGACVNAARGWGCKLMLVGGGGYHNPNTARVWAYLTSIATGSPLPLDSQIPEHAMFPAYAPSFTLDVPAGNMRDLNSDEYLTHVSAVFGAVSQELLERRLEEDREDMR